MAEEDEIEIRQQRLVDYVEKLRAASSNLEATRQLASEALDDPDGTLRTAMIAFGAEASPFSVPLLQEGRAAGGLSQDAWRKCVAMARMHAANTKAPRVLVSGAPKSASTFVTAKISKAYGLPYRSLMVYSDQPYFHQVVGAAERAQEVDELALLGYCYYPSGFAAHHHVQYTAYLGRQMKLYGILPVVTQRNIFDCFVSYDDHLFNNTSWSPERKVRITGFPDGWHEMDFDDRIAILIDKFLMWYIDYYASWENAARQRIIDPIRVVYERDMADGAELAKVISERLGEPPIGLQAFTEELSQKNDRGTLFNKGVAGRGSSITGKNRERILDTLYRFRSLCDLSVLVD